MNVLFAELWRTVFFLSFLVGFFQLLGLFFLPETPAWLLGHKQKSSAKKTLGELREGSDWKKHLDEMSEVADSKKIPRNLSSYKSILIVGLLLSVFQQITGVNTVIYYAPKIFGLSGDLSSDSALLATFGVGIINFVATLVAVWLLDKVGRRTLLLVGIFGMLVCQLFLGIAFAPQGKVLDIMALLSVMGYVCFFGIGLGPITWVVLSEIFPLKIRGKAVGMALFANWFANYLIALTFLPLLTKLGMSLTFFMYALITLIACIFVYFCIPETKGKSLEEIELMVNQDRFIQK